MRNKYIVAIVSVAFSLIVSCSKDDSDTTPGGNSIDCSGAPKTFSGDVNPLVQSVCNQPACHASGSTNGPGPLTNYTQVFNARALIRTAISTGFMPQNTSFTAAQKAAFVCWIDSGAPNN